MNIPLKRRKVRAARQVRPIVAYDFETTRIGKGTPVLKYITVYGDDIKISQRISNERELLDLLTSRLLIERYSGYRFVAWNANHFDGYFIARSLLSEKDSPWIIRPYVTKDHDLRGMRVYRANNPKASYEFLDGIAMTGNIGMPLKKFLSIFSPDMEKLALDFEHTEFDSENSEHVKYAERDSEGLFHAMSKAQKVLHQITGMDFGVTIGNVGVKYLQKMMPENVTCWKPNGEVLEVIFDYLMRGGFCCYPLGKGWRGKVWKYDINQAYAAAMRDCALPCGYMTISGENYMPGHVAMYKVQGCTSRPLVPFYFKNECGEKIASDREITATWITSVEYDQLISEGWQLEILDGYTWQQSFNLSAMVAELERMRFSDPAGPSGPIGTIAKNLGNHSYGKTGERLSGEDLIWCHDPPEGYFAWAPEDLSLDYIWCKMQNALTKPYHQPQISAFITAYVRMVVRRAILLDPAHWIYADTDCVAFSRPVKGLEIDPRKYGAWKIEKQGVDHAFVGKKIYADMENGELHAKGLNVKRLRTEHYEMWIEGVSPKQGQFQRTNIAAFLSGKDMFQYREKFGTKSESVKRGERVNV